MTVRRFPDDGVLSMEEFLAMHRVISEETRYRALAELLREDELSTSELAERLDVPSNRLHYHLDKLVDVGLVANRKPASAANRGCTPITSPPRLARRSCHTA